MTREEMLMKRYDDGGQRLKLKDEAVRTLSPYTVSVFEILKGRGI